MPEATLSIVMDMYRGASTFAVTAEGPTAAVPLLSGVKQGCPLSPILFNLAMEPIIRTVLGKLGATGYRMLEEGDGGVTINIPAYADDLVLLAKDTTWLDKRNAFGSMPYSFLIQLFNSLPIPGRL